MEAPLAGFAESGKARGGAVRVEIRQWALRGGKGREIAIRLPPHEKLPLCSR